jgi:SpoVK/Ycf46/Vps4 family AAA+-type ATPase
MLTKLNELRRSKGILFIIATNYENRIDPAIKRSGRIDRKYLVLPPDMEGRKRIISSLTGKDCPEELAKESYFLGYPDIQATVEKLGICVCPSSYNLEQSTA